MNSSPLRATLYANGTTPLFLDTAEITFTFADGPPVTAQVQVACVDYARNTATIVFCESDWEAIEALSLGRHFHTAVSIGELRAPKRAEDVTPDFEISHEMQVTLHALSGAKRDFDPDSLREGPIKERRQMLRAEDAIRAFQKAPSVLAQRTMLSRLAGFSDAQALSLLEGNRLPGSPQAASTIGGVRARRERMQAVAAITRRLKSNRLRFPVNAANPRYPGGRKAKALDVVTRRSGTGGRPFIGQIASIDRDGNAAVAFMSRRPSWLAAWRIARTKICPPRKLRAAFLSTNCKSAIARNALSHNRSRPDKRPSSPYNFKIQTLVRF